MPCLVDTLGKSVFFLKEIGGAEMEETGRSGGRGISGHNVLKKEEEKKKILKPGSRGAHL